MPSIKTTTPILPGKYYHLFNRGANKKSIFYKHSNYQFLLKLFGDHLLDRIDVLAYCLLPNHFHFIIRTKETSGEDESDYRKLMTSKFKSWLVTYAMAINKQEGFVGNLFDPKFKRLEIHDDVYLMYLIFYTHYNPEKHGVVDDFRNYTFSSYHSFFSTAPTKICRSSVLDIFGDTDAFINYHQCVHQERKGLILE